MLTRSPRAPIFRSRADSAIASRASSVKRSLTFSYSNSFMYCRVMALRGCVRIWMSAGLSSSCSVPTTGSRPPHSREGALFEGVVRPKLFERHPDAARAQQLDVGLEAERLLAPPPLDLFVQPDE